MAKKNKTEALANYDEELAALAAETVEQEKDVGGGQFFSLQGGQLSLGGAPLPNNEVTAIIVDSVMENVYYEGTYNPDEPAAPTCFAFGRKEDEIAPHENVKEPCAGSCAACPNNQWGSADTGRGKACRNRRRLALVPCGEVDATSGAYTPPNDASDVVGSEIAFLALPPTSIASWAKYAKQLAARGKPACAVVTHVSLVPDAKSQFKVCFQHVESLSGDLLKAALDLHKEARSQIESPYQAATEVETPKRGRGKTASNAAPPPAATRRRKVQKF